MYADERRSIDQLEALRAAELAADPGGLVARVDALQARRARDRQRIAELEAALKVAQSEARTAESARKKADAERSGITRRLDTVTESRDRHRAEAARLKDDLKRVRGSRALKVGRAVLAPASAMKKAFASNPEQEEFEADTRDDGTDSTAETPESATKAASEELCPSASKKVESKQPTVVPVGERTLEQLIEEFEKDHSPINLIRVVNRRWYQLGQITEPAELILGYPELIPALEPKQQRVAQQITGHYRLAQRELPIPGRARGIAYQPEPGRVLYCVHSTPAYNSNGYSTRTRGVAGGLRTNGTDVTVVARTGYPWDTKTDVQKPAAERTVSEVDGVEYVHIPGASLNSTPIDRYILDAADAFVREARLQRPAVIHAASNFRTALPALIAARRLGVPFVYEVRGLWEITEAAEKPGWESTERYRDMVGLETRVAQEADAIAVITSQVADELERRGVDRSKMVLAANAVDPNYFVPLPKDEQFAAKRKIRVDVPVIGFAGSIVPYEGLDTLLDASAMLEKKGTDHQVVIVGSGTDTEALKAKRDQLGLGNVLFLGRLPMADMPRLMSTFDIMPLPRNSSAVTELVSPLKPLEAFSSAKAVVLSDVAPHLDLAGAAGERGLLFPAGDSAVLAERLERLIIDPDLREDLGRTARLWTIDARTWQQLGLTLAGAYDFAQGRHEADLSDGRELSSLRVGLVADEFTTATLSASMQVTSIDRRRWQEQIDTAQLDLVFIESAWAGNDGQWTKGVGYYGEEENADLYGMLGKCRELGIPTVFWNKEDPVHFDRFRQTAALCDHIFTTDGNKIGAYLETPGAVTSTASSLPFYAQPAIHNPLPPRTAYEATAAYAGTYYGDRYKTRSRQLSRLLTEASRYGLAIYDRQLAYPDSPYKFPPELRRYVRGNLPYDQVIDSYKSHLAQLNVNSVIDSPTMFSRRVVEVAACGGVVLSGPGRGVTETFGGVIPASNENALWRALLFDWISHPEERVREAWFQMRAVYRSHTIDTAMTILARTAGLCVSAPARATYGLLLDGEDSAVLESVAAQSVLPSEVFVSGGFDAARRVLSPLGVRVRGTSALEHAASEWLGRLDEPAPRTYFEDLLLATRFGDWNRLTSVSAGPDDVGRPLASKVDAPIDAQGLVRLDLVQFSKSLDRALTTRPVLGVQLLLPPKREAFVEYPTARAASVPAGFSARVIVAGHDLKFAGGLIDALSAAGHTVDIDEWTTHTKHDEARSTELLEKADVIFCEWGLGNAVWYAKHAKPHQRVVVRVHSQELRRPFLSRIAHKNVDAYVFVGELIRRAATESHGVPAEKTLVISNPVHTRALDRPKHAGAPHTLGLVGVVAQPKRLDRALTLLERLQETDGRYRLRIKGRVPADYPWMLNRPEEMAYYDAQYARIDEINKRYPDSVLFDGHGADMEEWYRNIGVAISVSDFESFHYTVPDGAASGALPATIDWPGADLIYPREWVSATIDQMAERILTTNVDPAHLAGIAEERFGAEHVYQDLVNVTVPWGGEAR